MLAEMVGGKRPRPRLDSRAGVHYQWLFPRDVVTWLVEPWHLPTTFAALSLPHRHVDLEPLDVGPTLRAGRLLLYYLKQQLKTRAVWKQKHLIKLLQAQPLCPGPQQQSPPVAPLPARESA